MSREKIGPKQSSTVSAREAYQRLVDHGYRPCLVNEEKPLRSEDWKAVIVDANVVHSASGKSIQMIDATGQNRSPVDLKIKGMMSESSVSFFEKKVKIPMKPAP